MKTLKYILAVLVSLIILIGLEGILTMGNAFIFENYSWFSWLCQAIITSIFVIIGIIIADQELNKK